MAGGARFKFTGSFIRIMTGYNGVSPPAAITAATKANPCVLTVVGHGLADGAVVKVADVVGMTELNGFVYIVDVLTSDTFALRDTDSTAYGAYVSGGDISVAAFSNFCELTNYNHAGGSSPDIPASSLCSTSQEFEVGLSDPGTTNISFHFAPNTAVQGALHAWWESGDTMAIQTTLPNGGGNMTQLARVQQESETAAVSGLWDATATLRNSGRPFRY